VIALLLNLYHVIAPFDQTASIPGDMTYLGKGKVRSAVSISASLSHSGDRESAIAWESRYL